MPTTAGERLVALLGVVLILVLAAFGALHERRVDAGTQPAKGPAGVGSTAASPDGPGTTPTAAQRKPVGPATGSSTREEPAPAAVAVVVAAARGDSWLAVRRATPEGAVLYEGILAQGQTRRFVEVRLWMRLGAAANLDLVVNGKRVPHTAGTIDLVVTPKQVAVAAAA